MGVVKKNTNVFILYFSMAASDNIGVNNIPFFEKFRLPLKNVFERVCVYCFFGIRSN